jgi:hypothetical protein
MERFDCEVPKMIEERQKLLDEYAATSRAFCDAVERLRRPNTEVEAFILGLAEVGTAHRACEQSRIKLDKCLAQRGAPLEPRLAK